MHDLFADIPPANATPRQIANGAWHLPGFCFAETAELIAGLADLFQISPLRQMMTPGGKQIQVHATNCGTYGWVSDARGYRYQRIDPLSGENWPALPPLYQNLAEKIAQQCGYDHFSPDACLINQYQPQIGMSLHQDKNEMDFAAPIVTISLGIAAVFMFGGAARRDKTDLIRLEHGDAIVFGGESRQNFHGIKPLVDNSHPDLGAKRISLTFRQARRPYLPQNS